MAGKILDLGCGSNKTQGAVGVDIVKLPGVDVICDFDRKRLPFKNNTFDEASLVHVLEHMSNPLFVLEELWRVCRNGARVVVKVPHFSSRGAWIDPEHKRAFALGFFEFFGENDYSYYSKARFKVLKKHLIFRAGKPSIFTMIVQFFADLNPEFCERNWLYWFGGFSHLEFELEVQK